MVRKYGHLVQRREFMCGLMKRQETALDQIEIEITATPNLPVEVLTVGRYLDSILKGWFFEYLTQLPNFRIRDVHGVKMVIEFDQRLEALNLKITSPLDTTVFRNIRLPFWLRQIFPLHHSTNLVEQVYRALFGERLFGKCILDRGHVHTFDKRTYNYHLDDCYHLVAADCTKRNTHAILAKEIDNVKHVMIFFENHKFVIEEPALRYTRPTTAFTVKMQTGQERMVTVEVMPDRVVRLLGGLVTVRWSRGTLVVDTPAHRVIYNGKVLDVLDKALMAAGDQCGLCGDHNRMRLADIKSSTRCIHTSLISMAHSFRVNSAMGQCTPLPTAAIERLSSEKAMCGQPRSPLQISYFTPVTQAKMLRHAVLHRAGQVCFSKMMLPECRHRIHGLRDPGQGGRLRLSACCCCRNQGHPEEGPPRTGVHRIDNHGRHIHHKGPRGQGVQASVTSNHQQYLVSNFIFSHVLSLAYVHYCNHPVIINLDT